MKMAKRLISVVLVVLMLLSMSVVAASAYTVPDGFEVTDKDAAEIDGQVYGRIGDADMSDVVNVRDATLIQKSAADLAVLDDVQKVLADTNFDGKVNVKDATAIQKWVADLETLEPINQIIYIPEVGTEPTEPDTTVPDTDPTVPETTVPDTEPTEPEATTPDETEPTEPDTEPTEPEETTPDETVPTEPETTEPEVTEPETTVPEANTITIYFSNNNGWENVYIYGFYGVEGSAATGEPLGTYPGTKMTFVEKNGYGQDIYSAEVPADIDYIKFTDGSASNNRTNNIPKTEIADNAGFYLTDDLGNSKWGYGTYEYIPAEPETTVPEVTEPEETTPDETVPTESEATEPEVTEPDTTVPEANTITIYFSNNNGWENVYIYGFYGVEGGAATGEPLGTYPGTKMTFVEKNGYGQDIYSAEVPADIDYIKFADGTSSNNRTNNIPKTEIADNTGFYITDNLGGTKWDYGTYEYAPTEPEATEPEVTTPDETVPTEPEATEPEATTPDETEPEATEPDTTVPEANTITIYFSNNNGWENVYIYGFYGVEGGAATGEPLGTYPGTKMTFVEKNGFDQDIYSAEVPADIDYIKFADGTASNNRTNNIPKTEIADNTGFYITDNLGGTKWDYGTYEYAPTEPEATEPEVTTPDETVPTEPEATEPEATEPETTEPETTEPETTVPEANTITIYFSNNNGWENVYIYGFYGVEGGAATGEPLGTYPGTKMTFVEKNGYGQDIYSAEVPADIDYIKFADGTASNNRTNNIPKTEIADNTGFYITDNLGGTKWGYGTYEYAPTEPEVTEPEVTTPDETVPTEPEATEPEATEPEATEPEATEPEATEPETTVPEANTITIYFSNNNGWENVYIYGFYGVEGGAATGEPLGTYPGTKMTFVEKNDYGQDIYSAEVPADIDYIKFADGTSSNNRTNNIPKTEIADNTGFYITDNLGGTKWGYGTYEYAPTEPEVTDPEATEPEVTVPTEPDTTAPTEPKPTDPPADEIKVYFVNSGKWSKVNAYAWSPEPAAWPGAAMTKTGEKAPNGADVYVMTFSQSYSNIIFNAGSGSSQTDDLTFTAGQYFDYMTGKWYANLEDIPAEQAAGFTVYCVNSKNWSKINAYVWGPNDAGWPGSAMTKTGEKSSKGYDIYSYTFAQKHTNVIFNDGSSQTADLTFQAGQYFDLASGKWYANADTI